MTTTRAGNLIQRWYCSDCECEHEGSVLGGVVVPPGRGTQLQSLWEAESARVEDEDYNDSSIGGDEPFCEHGNLLWSEDCNECDEAMKPLPTMRKEQRMSAIPEKKKRHYHFCPECKKKAYCRWKNCRLPPSAKVYCVRHA